MPSRWITIRRPFDFTWPSRAITSFRDEHLGEHLVKGELADFAVANGHATEGKVDGSARSAKGTGKRRTSRRKGTGNAKATVSRPVAPVGDADAADAGGPADRPAVDSDAK